MAAAVFCIAEKMLAMPWWRMACTAQRGSRGGIFCSMRKRKEQCEGESGSASTSIEASARAGGKSLPERGVHGCGGSSTPGSSACRAGRTHIRNWPSRRLSTPASSWVG